jgi:hypothetical protein
MHNAQWTMENAQCHSAFSIHHSAFSFLPCDIIFKSLRRIISHMNTSSFQFPLLALALLFLALLILDVLGGAAGAVYGAFAPALLWAIVLAVKGRR